MPSNNKSPFTTSFNSGIKRGTPYLTVVNNIAKRTGKSVDFIFGSLFKAGIVTAFAGLALYLLGLAILLQWQWRGNRWQTVQV